jgi:hypothetical protein
MRKIPTATRRKVHARERIPCDRPAARVPANAGGIAQAGRISRPAALSASYTARFTSDATLPDAGAGSLT